MSNGMFGMFRGEGIETKISATIVGSLLDFICLLFRRDQGYTVKGLFFL